MARIGLADPLCANGAPIACSTPREETWSGLRVEGTEFVDGDGRTFLPRGIGIGEWLDLESDVPGLGMTRLHTALVDAIGTEDADRFFATWQDNLVTEGDPRPAQPPRSLRRLVQGSRHLRDPRSPRRARRAELRGDG